MPMIPFCPTCLPPSGCETKPPGKCVLYSGVYLPFIGVTAGQNLDTILGTLNSILESSSGGLSTVSHTDSATISFSGDGTLGNPLSAEFIGTIPLDTNIYNTSGTISGVQRLVTGEYSSGLTFSWKDQFGTPDSFLIGVNSGGGGGRVRMVGPTGSLVITHQDLRLGSAGTSTTQAYLQVDMTDFNFVFGADPTIVNIKNDGLYLPITPNLSSLATDSTGKVVAGAAPSLQSVTDIGATTSDIITVQTSNAGLFAIGSSSANIAAVSTGVSATGAGLTSEWGNGTDTAQINIITEPGPAFTGRVYVDMSAPIVTLNHNNGLNISVGGTITNTFDISGNLSGADAVNPNHFVTLNQLTGISGSYIQNQTASPQTAGFSISGIARIGTSLGIGTAASALLHIAGTTEQLRVGYDAINYLSIASTNSTGSFMINAVGTNINRTITINPATLFPSGITTGTFGTNLYIGNVTAAFAATDPRYLFAGASSVGGGVGITSSFAHLVSVNNSYGSLIIGNNTITTTATGINNVISSLVVKPPTINSGGSAINIGSSFYVEGPTTGASLNYASYISSGLSYFGGQIQIAGGTPGVGKVLTSDATGLASWTTPSSGGSVTSVDMTVPSVLTVTGNPITTSGTLAVTFATGQTANQVLASPNGSTGAISLRSLVAADIPSLDTSKVTTGILPIARGGTNIGTIGTAGQLVRVNPGATAYEFFTATYLTTNQTITLTGDVTGSGTTAITTVLANTGTSGTYTKVTTDAQGRVSSGTTLAATDIPVLDAAKITTGTLGTARLGSGTADTTVFLRGDGTWSNTLAGAFNTTGKITSTLTTEQLRTAYDASNYMNVVVASSGSTTFDLTGTSPLFTFGKGTSFTAGIAANNTGFNLSVVSINGGTSTTSATYLFGGAATINYRVGVRGSGANTLAAASSGTNFIVGDNSITTAASGTSAVVSNIVVKGHTITATSGSTITNATSLYIDAAPTISGAGTVTNTFSLLVNAGVSYLKGGLRFDQGSDATGDIYYRASTGLLTRLGIGSTGNILSVSGGLPAWAAAGTVLPIRATSTNDTLTSSDYSIVVNTTAASLTIALPAAASSTGKQFNLINIGSNISNSMIVDPNGAELIGGASTYTTNIQYKSVIIMCDGTGWFIISSN